MPHCARDARLCRESDIRPGQRLLVAGTSGSGRTTLAAGIALALQLPQVEIDALFHGSAWTPPP